MNKNFPFEGIEELHLRMPSPSLDTPGQFVFPTTLPSMPESAQLPPLPPFPSPENHMGVFSTDREVGPYMLMDSIGRGLTGEVKLGIHKLTGEKFALKIMEKSALATNRVLASQVQREISILRQISHPNIVSLHEVFDLETHFVVVMEYISGGEMLTYINSKRHLPKEEALNLIMQVVLALEHCHAHLIVHRDVKLENIMLTDNGKVKVIDFGLAFPMTSNDQLLDTSCGSPHYSAPEVASGSKYDGRISDVWSVGVCLYALLTGRLPFSHPNLRELSRIVCRGQFEIPSDIASDQALCDLLRHMLTVDPAKRIRMDKIAEHPCMLPFAPTRVIVPDRVRSPSSQLLSESKTTPSPPSSPPVEIETSKSPQSNVATRRGVHIAKLSFS